MVRYSYRLKELIDDLYYDRLEERNLDSALNKIFEVVLHKQINVNTLPDLYDVRKPEKSF